MFTYDAARRRRAASRLYNVVIDEVPPPCYDLTTEAAPAWRRRRRGQCAPLYQTTYCREMERLDDDSILSSNLTESFDSVQ